MGDAIGVVSVVDVGGVGGVRGVSSCVASCCCAKATVFTDSQASALRGNDLKELLRLQFSVSKLQLKRIGVGLTSKGAR